MQKKGGAQHIMWLSAARASFCFSAGRIGD